MNKRTIERFFHFLQLPALLILCLLQLPTTAQIKEDFSDQDLTVNPPWDGDLSRFEVNAYQQLRLKGTGAGSSYISTPLTCIEDMEWSLWIHLSFSPSDNNYLRFYLASDHQDPASANKAFYLQLGESGSKDAITLFYKNGTTIKEICRGTSGLIANAFSIRILVTRSKEGNWKIFTDPIGSFAYSLETSATESAPLPSGYVTIFCKYTASNSSGFYLDDISAEPFISVNNPPELIDAMVPDDNQIKLTFNEPLEKSASLQINNFRLSNGKLPKNAYFDAETATIIWLTFDQTLPLNQPFSLNVQGITDIAGNKAPKKEVMLVYHQLQWNDILINEIMANPVPSNGLPGVEYLELYNRSAFPIHLKNWSLMIGKKQQKLPDSTINSHEYRIIAAQSNITKFKQYGKTLAVKNLSLPNEGTLIVIRDPLNQTIHAVNYKPSWHTIPTKKAGGWSLEMVDPLNPCGEEANFQSSTDPLGGTPGKVNSVNTTHPDQDEPEISSIYPIDSLHLKISFTETVDSVQLLNTSTYVIEPLVGNPKNIISTNSLYQSVILELSHPLTKETHYTLIINAVLKDCSGNLIKAPVKVTFGLPAALKTNSIVINEIMYDPGVDKSEFIEIYNRSTDFYDLSKIYLSAENTTSQTIKQRVPLSDAGRLISPNQYMVLTPDKKKLLNQYRMLSRSCVVEPNKFPSLSNEGGIVILTDSSGQNIIDKAPFNNELHFSLLRSTTGVSLERINTDAPSESKSNWHSASEAAGFSTPGKINSQHISQNTTPTLLTLEPETFSPDNDGIDDNLTIHCNPEKPGYLLTLIIFDANGRPIRKLLTNVLLSTENNFTWDGLTDEHKKANGGVYIVYAEIFTTNGEVHHIKKSVILANRFTR